MQDGANRKPDDLLMPFADQLRVVIETREIVDGIDLVKADPTTCVRFRALRRLYVGQAINLIDMIREHGDILREQLEAMLLDS